MIRVTFADGATEDREDDTTCRPDPHSDFESAIHLYRGSRVEVKRGDIWDDCHVETFEEQIARLMAERDAWERSARDIAAGSDARGATIWRLQNRLSRWYRRFTRVDVALRQWKPLAQAWQARCEEAQAGERAEKARGDAAEKRLADLRAWADELANGQSDSPEGRRVAGDCRAVVYRIDGKAT